MSEENRRSTDNTIMKMAEDIGYIRGKVETITTASGDHEKRMGSLETSRVVQRAVIASSILGGVGGAAKMGLVEKMLTLLGGN